MQFINSRLQAMAISINKYVCLVYILLYWLALLLLLIFLLIVYTPPSLNGTIGRCNMCNTQHIAKNEYCHITAIKC